MSARRPFDLWLHAQGDWIVASASAAGSQLDGMCDGVAAWWRGSWLGSSMRGRVERVAEHHESLESERFTEEAASKKRL